SSSRDLLAIFFFQAEDGIRDRNVTGVQTCALPISVVFQVLGGHRLKEEAAFPVGQTGQGRRLAGAGGQGLFHNDVPAGLQRRLGVGGVQQVGQGDVDHVHRRQQLAVVGDVERHAVLGAEGGGLVR